jgi:hypothetical protein
VVVLGALAGHGVGFDLSGPLRQQAQGFFDPTGQLFFDLAQVLLGMGEDHLQAPIHIFEPGLDLGLGQGGFSQACGLCGSGGFGRSAIQNVLSQAPSLCLGCCAGGGPRRVTGLRPANLA